MKKMKKAIAFALALAMILTMNVGLALATDTQVEVGTKPKDTSGIATVSNIEITDGKLVVKGTLATPEGEIAGALRRATGQYLSDFDGSAYPEVVSGSSFEVYFTIGKLQLDGAGNGDYFIALGDNACVDFIPPATDNGYRVTFLVRNNQVQSGWDKILRDPSSDFTVGDPTSSTTTAAVGTSVTFTVGTISTGGGIDLAANLPVGDTLTYQWKHSNPDGNTDISGATRPALTVDSLTMDDAGAYTCAVTYTESGKAPKTVESSAATLAVTKATPTITIVTAAPSATYSGIGLEVPVGTAITSAASITYSYTTAGGFASLKDGLPLTAGTYDVVATSEEDENYSEITIGGITLTVNPADQTLTAAAVSTSYNATLDLTGKATNDRADGGTITYIIVADASNTAGASTTNGGLALEFTTKGAVTIKANAVAVDGKYNAATEITFLVTVTEGEAVTVGDVKTVDGGTYVAGGVTLGGIDGIDINPAPKVTAANGGAEVAGTWSWKTPATKLTAGITTCDAIFTPNDALYATATAQIPVTVAKATPTISLTLTPTGAAVASPAAASVVLSCDADTAVEVTYASSNMTVATVNSATGAITPAAKGTTTITADYAGDANYNTVSTSAIFTTQAEPEVPTNLKAAGDGKLNVTWTAPDANGAVLTGYTLTFKYEDVVSTTAAIKYDYNGKTITTTGGIADIGGYTSGGALYVSEGGVEYPVTTSAAIINNMGEVTVTKSALGTATSYEFSPAVNDKPYKISIVATNAIGDSTPSAEITATPAKSGGGGGGGGGGSVTTPSYTVEFKAGDHGTLEGKTSITVDKDGKIKDLPTVKAKAGYVFLGWSKDGKTVLDLSTYKVTEKVTLTALYQKGTGYITGYTDGTFRPDNNMTRAEVATVLAKLSKSFEAGKTYEGSFTDAAGWYKDYVNFAASNSIFSGYADDTFRPENNITRAEFAACLANFLKVKSETAAEFGDVSGHWAQGYIAALSEKGIVSGYEDNTFRPENNITRAEVATMINLALNVKLSGTGAIVPNDVTKSHWAYDQIIKSVNADIEGLIH